MTRLYTAALAALPATVARPDYDRDACGVGIVHLGNGAFHRAHQAVYLDDLLARRGGDWALCSVSLRRADARDRLLPQDGLYTVAERGPEGARYRVIGALREALFAADDPAALLSRLTRPQSRLVTLTITEKGYCRDPASGALLADDPEVRHDLAHPAAPTTALGYLAEALARRRAAGVAPFTVLSCDNLPENGAALRRVLLEFAALRDDALAAWIEREVAFPGSVVDRIVPATTSADLDDVDHALGCHDAAAVVCEPFRQWVIEDRFCAARPALEEVGVELVADVTPYETMKLRLLNGPHSALAYLGYLAGREHVSDCMADAALAAYAHRLMAEEIEPTVHMPGGYDLASYGQRLRERFANPGLQHRTWQIAMDGSQKLPQRLLGTARDRLAAGQPIPLLALAIAGWMYYVGGVDPRGREIEVRDPLADRLRGLADRCRGDPSATVRVLVGVEAVFGTDLARDDRFVTAVTEALASLCCNGPRAAVRRAAAD